MAEHRPFSPSPRRRALARQAGLHAASPLVTGAAAAAAALVAAGAVGGSLVSRLGGAVVAACSAPGAHLTDGPPAAHASGPAALGAAAPAALGAAAPAALGAAAPAAHAAHAALPLDTLARTIVNLVMPILAAAAIAALVAHLAQTRAGWLPRRRIPRAPALDAGPAARVRRSGGELAAAAVLAGVAFGWLWWMAPRLASLVAIEPHAATSGPLRGVAGLLARVTTSPLLAGAAALLTSLASALVIAWVALGIIDALVRHAALSRALAMTSTEKREDDRLAGADPRWRARRAAIARGPRVADAVAGASLLVLGDDAAVAIAWDPLRRPIPVRTATGRGPRATQLLGLARRHRIAVHRDPALAAALVDGDGPVPEQHWPRLADVIAATRGRATASDVAPRAVT